MRKIQRLYQVDVSDSQAVKQFAYCPDSRELTVTYLNGRSYVYTEVPSSILTNLVFASSVGKAVNTYVKGRYDLKLGDE